MKRARVSGRASSNSCSHIKQQQCEAQIYLCVHEWRGRGRARLMGPHVPLTPSYVKRVKPPPEFTSCAMQHKCPSAHASRVFRLG